MDLDGASPRKPQRADASSLDVDAADEALTTFPRALVETAVARVVSSATFRRSVRHRQFLEHLVRTTLDGQQERLKEVMIGIEVFDRRVAAYDPKSDPIVRVEAGRLREKLGRYYGGEGAVESFEIVVPVGGYVPRMMRRSPVARPVAALGSFAVLPFANLADHEDDAALSAGLADQLIDTLGRVPGIKVVARLSAFSARERLGDVKSVGRLLGVTHVIEGSIQRSGSRVRCIAQLSRTRDGVRIWSRRFELAGDDVFAFQDEIADAVLTAITALTDASGTDGATRGARPVRRAGTEDRRARDLFERGRYVAQQRTIDGYRKAIELFGRAVTIDPSYAQPHAAIAMAEANLAGFVIEPTLAAFRRAEVSARRALALDPHDGDALTLLAVIAHRMEHDWPKAQALFVEALRLAPSSTIPHGSYAMALLFNGHVDEAVRHGRVALELDPLNLALRVGNIFLYAYARQIDVALADAQAVLELDPGHLFGHIVSGMTLLWSDRPDDAAVHFDFVARTLPDHATAWFGKVCVHGLRGTPDDLARGRADLAALVARLEGRHYSAVHRAMAEASLGDRDACYASLERAGLERDLLFVTVPADRLFDRFHADPAFIALLRRHGLDVPAAFRAA